MVKVPLQKRTVSPSKGFSAIAQELEKERMTVPWKRFGDVLSVKNGTAKHFLKHTLSCYRQRNEIVSHQYFWKGKYWWRDLKKMNVFISFDLFDILENRFDRLEELMISYKFDSSRNSLKCEYIWRCGGIAYCTISFLNGRIHNFLQWYSFLLLRDNWTIHMSK